MYSYDSERQKAANPWLSFMALDIQEHKHEHFHKISPKTNSQRVNCVDQTSTKLPKHDAFLYHRPHISSSYNFQTHAYFKAQQSFPLNFIGYLASITSVSFDVLLET